MWPYLATTIRATLIGTTIGLVLGAIFGLVFSNFSKLAEIANPFIVVFNSVPRIAIIPLFVVVMGPTVAASVLSIVAVVFFLAFYNAFQGGRSVTPVVLENAGLLGASPFQIMRYIRFPVVMIWTFASVPNAISFGLIVAVTTEWFAGVPGMGALLATATGNLQVGITFAIIVVLSIVGLLLNIGTSFLRGRLMRWGDVRV
jgi:NitT/TauT family transport system permease protein